MASFYDWAFRWLQSLLALKICSVSQKIHKNCEKNENLPSKRQKMTFWCGRKKWRGRWTVNNSFRSVGLKYLECIQFDRLTYFHHLQQECFLDSLFVFVSNGSASKVLVWFAGYLSFEICFKQYQRSLDFIKFWDIRTFKGRLPFYQFALNAHTNCFGLL